MHHLQDDLYLPWNRKAQSCPAGSLADSPCVLGLSPVGYNKSAGSRHVGST